MCEKSVVSEGNGIVSLLVTHARGFGGRRGRRISEKTVHAQGGRAKQKHSQLFEFCRVIAPNSTLRVGMNMPFKEARAGVWC